MKILKMDEIIKILNQDYKETGGSGLFGIQVASDWEDRCYGFQFAGDISELHEPGIRTLKSILTRR